MMSNRPPGRASSLSPRWIPAFSLFLLLPMHSLAAQGAMTIPELQGEIALDGSVDEAAWLAVEPLPMVVFAPRYGAPPTQRTEVRLGHDSEYLYMSARCFDTDPSGIRANALVRDDDAEDDFVNLVIDTFNDHENAVWFLVTPLGARVDGAITGNAEGSAWNHVEYDSFWDAATSLNPEGWSAEMRIPLTSLRFRRDSTGAVTMGVIVGRFISRSGERHVFPDIRPGPATAHYKPSLAAPMRLDHVDDRTAMYLQPYALVGTERSVYEPGVDPRLTRSFIHEVGGDAKIGVASNLTMDLTVNTDFAQTEIDDARVNLTRYSLFLPEKRAFFLERSGTFAMDAGADVHLFDSRRIGLDANGLPLRVYAGGRLVGRMGRWDIGALDMQTEGPDDRPASNAGVVRVRRSVGGVDSYVGGILTSSTHASAPWTAGVDGVLNVAGDDYVSFEAGITPSNGGTSWEDALGRLLVERRNKKGWAYRGEAAFLGGSFDPALGFVLRSGLTTGELELSYGRFGGRLFQASGLSFTGAAATRHQDHGVESARIGISWFGDRRGGGRGQVDLAWRYEGLLIPFQLGDAEIPEGVYRFTEATAALETPKGRSVRGTLTLSGGSFYDGYRTTISLSPTWAMSRYLLLSSDIEANWVWFPSRDERYDAYVTRVRLRVSPDTHLSLNALVQRDGAAGATTGNLRIRYMIRDGSDVYLVFNTGQLDRGLLTPGTLQRRNSMVFKYTTTVRFRD